uniref:Uncharacterized protein n=1 Tax=Arundo donax TaxID=35708 RepID=A0A0A9ED35_ARUDO
MGVYFLFDTHGFGGTLLIGKACSSHELFSLMHILYWKLRYSWFAKIIQALKRTKLVLAGELNQVLHVIHHIRYLQATNISFRKSMFV